MYKLRATILKDMRVLARDRIGLVFMFAMPIVLVLIVTSIQNGTFELVNKTKIPILICNRDTGNSGVQFVSAIDKMGMFKILPVAGSEDQKALTDRVQAKDALLGMIIPSNFSARVSARTKRIAGKALNSFGLADSAAGKEPISPVSAADTAASSILLFYHPVLENSYRQSAQGALYSALQLVESKQLLKTLYFSLNEKDLPETLEQDILANRTPIEEVPVNRGATRNAPNATQHNVPAWTIFAMFFVVLSLGSGVVREKLNGSFVRLKTLPTSYLVAIFSKQITYLFVTMVQAAVIFAIGIWLLPAMGLPALNLPADLTGLILVSILCGLCAVSYAICVGVFAQTEEQANGFGAVSIVILAAIGGLMVPSFAMPGSFQTVMKFSPLHWCLESYYGLFLEGGNLKNVLSNIIPLLLIIAGLQGLTLWGLKRKNLI